MMEYCLSFVKLYNRSTIVCRCVATGACYDRVVRARAEYALGSCE